MAKRKNKRSVVYRFKKKARRAASKAKPLGGLLGAGLYGAVRARVSNYLQQYTNKIPLGNVSDEVGMLAVNYVAGKYIGRKLPIVRDMAKAGNMIEAARIGEAIATGSLGSIGAATTSTASNGVIIVGGE